MLPLFYTFVVLYTFCGVFIYEYAINVPFDLYELISHEDIYKSALIFLLSSFSFFVGSSLIKYKSKGYVLTKRQDVKFKYQKSLLFTIFIIYGLYVIGYGAETLWSRSGYIDVSVERNKSILIIFFATSPFVTTLIPFIRNLFLKYFVYFLCFLILFSASSRFVIMLPFLYIVGSFLKSNKIRIKVILFNLTLILLSLIFILQIRYYEFHGLIPNLSALFTKGIDMEFLAVGLNYALSFSLFGTAYVLNGDAIHDSVAFMIGLNPLPSMFLDMSLLSSQRMLGTSPMSALSILSLAGYQIIISYYLLTGAIFSLILNKMKGVSFLYYAVVGLFVMFALFSIQYNLRGLTRFVYYSLVIFIGFYISNKFRIKKRQGRS